MTTQIDAGFLKATKKSGSPYAGHVSVYSVMECDVVLIANDMTGRGKDAPQFRVERVNRATGEAAHIGNAWVKKSKEGREFLSMTLDNPRMSASLNLTAFPPDAERGEESWRIVWSRPRVKVDA